MVARKKSSLVIKAGNKCSCNVVGTLLALILFAVGFWVLINGIWIQWNTSTEYWIVMLWYLVGFLILMVAKIAKFRSCVGCSIHKRH